MYSLIKCIMLIISFAEASMLSSNPRVQPEAQEELSAIQINHKPNNSSENKPELGQEQIKTREKSSRSPLRILISRRKNNLILMFAKKEKLATQESPENVLNESKESPETVLKESKEIPETVLNESEEILKSNIKRNFIIVILALGVIVIFFKVLQKILKSRRRAKREAACLEQLNKIVGQLGTHSKSRSSDRSEDQNLICPI